MFSLTQLWLAAFLLSLAALTLNVAGVCRHRHLALSWRSSFLTTCVLVWLLAADGLHYFSAVDREPRYWLQLLVVVLASGTVWLGHLAAAWLDRSMNRWQSLLGIAWPLLLVMFVGIRLNAEAQPIIWDASDVAVDFEFNRFGALVEHPEVEIITDQGRRLSVHRRLAPAVLDEMEPTSLNAMRENVIRLTPADGDSNCHGWVFTNGVHLIGGQGAQVILDDNGYECTDQPRTGDLIVYRDDNDVILHTGLVKYTDDNGMVLIESKWGAEGRFLHQPDQQPYSDAFTYYRTSRPNHTVRLVPRSESDSGHSEDREFAVDASLRRSPQRSVSKRS